MSYDFTLLKLEPGEDIHDALELSENADLTEESLEVIAQRNQELIGALRNRNPGLQVTETEDYIEFNNDKNGIQISLFEDEIGIGIPYWHKGSARSVFQEVWEYLRIIQSITGYVVYDPQLDKLLDLNTDFDEALDIYSAFMGRL